MGSTGSWWPRVRAPWRPTWAALRAKLGARATPLSRCCAKEPAGRWAAVACNSAKENPPKGAVSEVVEVQEGVGEAERERGRGVIVGEEALRGENTFRLSLAANFIGSGNCCTWTHIFSPGVLSFFWRSWSKDSCLIVAAAIPAEKADS